MNLTSRAHNATTTVVHVQGSLDGDSYGRLIVEAQQLLARGTRNLLIELTDCEYMSSAGIMALTSIFKQMRDLTRAEANISWEAKNTLDRAGALGATRQLILVAPCPDVERVLSMAGMQAYLPVYPDLAKALAAMQAQK